ncbi:ThuA domain-containing protein [Aurantibacter crassamenti]|uniref:ThuA domain-containing protein n=1 Tax=Aurantibacter crassamenti TaxID=1837375 RepID=UPI00193A2881|nr:ThuA domain-containing protein [Aurantibacter crassamenti]MBM1106791.1 ThuA domain-containing protein [Aurantibacter crassamenti]
MRMKKNQFRNIVFTLIGMLISQSIIAQSQFKVLLITETAGWHHASIDHGIVAINELAATHNFEVVRQQDAQSITEESLQNYDAVIFLNTSADIFDNEEQLAFEKYIQSGNGYVGIHAASDTEYDWPWYTKLVGRMFHIHPLQQTAKLKIIDHNFPGLEHFPDTLLFTDEWYEFSEDKVSGLHNLILIDENSYDAKVTWKNRDLDKNGNRTIDRVGEGMAVHPISWYHEFDGGRSFYTALGHINNVYKNNWFREHLYGGIYYAATGKGIETQ